MQYSEIQSKDNEKIKTLRKLQSKKYRSKLGVFCVENKTIILDAFDGGVIPEEIFVEKKFLENNKEKLKDVFEGVASEKMFVITPSVNKSFSSLETPSGICAVYKKEDRPVEMSGKMVYLNAISDPGNVGTILRSALAFGFENVVVDEWCADLHNPKTIQASKGAIFNLNISFDKDFEILKKIKNEMKIISTDVKRGIDCRDFEAEKKFCLVLGNETRGVDERVQEMADIFLNIKISSKMESLNVSSSAAILFFELGE